MCAFLLPRALPFCRGFHLFHFLSRYARQLFILSPYLYVGPAMSAVQVSSFKFQVSLMSAVHDPCYAEIFLQVWTLPWQRPASCCCLLCARILFRVFASVSRLVSLLIFCPLPSVRHFSLVGLLLVGLTYGIGALAGQFVSLGITRDSPSAPVRPCCSRGGAASCRRP